MTLHRAFVIATLVTLTGVATNAAGVEPWRPAVRRFDVTYTATVKEWPAGVKQIILWVPIPPTTDVQAISDVHVLRIDGNDRAWELGEYREEVYGNRVKYYKPRGPGPFAVTVSYRVERREERILDARPGATPRPAPGPGVAPDPMYLRPDRLGVVDDRIRKLAGEITAGRRGELEQARAVYDYVLGHMAYDKTTPGWGKGDTRRACDVGRGNCTDFHALFISLVRARGIPARLHMGASLPAGKTEGALEGYHCWAEFWVGGRGWVPVDASEAWKNADQRDFLFGNLDADRVEFSVGRDLKLPGMQGELLTFMSGPYAEADGKPFTGVEKSVSFKENLAVGAAGVE
jgi:transglutaminase-like putative cysteine protease